MRPDEHQAAVATVIHRKWVAHGAIAFALQVARFKAAKAKSLGERGTALVEFGLLAPVLLLILLGTAQFGLTLNQFVTLTNSVSVGALQFALSRSDTTPSSDAWKAITAAASTLTPTTNIKITLSVGSPLVACVTNANSLGSAAAADSACATALTNNIGQPAQVTATFPCNLQVMWYNFAPTCNLTSQVTERVQ
jgi:Flp pilus assembly protein TadG